MNGHFVISLDFELFWGVFDVRSLDSYKKNLLMVRDIIPRLLELCDIYDISISFATVGLLFAKTKEELLNSCPNIKPTYTNQNFSPYRIIDTIGKNEEADPYHYANSLIKLIDQNGKHEIGSHTFCHYYCNEKGQDKFQFEEDIKATINMANNNQIDIKSIVFPRNQTNNEYLPICLKYGITSYRGTEKHWMHSTTNIEKQKNPLYRVLRLLDCYFNLTGFNTYNANSIDRDHSLMNIASSKFLRPYNKILSFLEPLKVSRIKKAMSYAAKNNEIYHLWWHPHNFGDYMDENFETLEQIFKHYKYLKTEYRFKSTTMTGLTNELKSV